MLCPICGQETRVIETDKLESVVLRIRGCKNSKCRQIFQTQEAVSTTAMRPPAPKTPPRARKAATEARAKAQPQGRA